MKLRCRLGFHDWKVRHKTRFTDKEVQVGAYRRCRRPGCRYDLWMLTDLRRTPRPPTAETGVETDYEYP